MGLLRRLRRQSSPQAGLHRWRLAGDDIDHRRGTGGYLTGRQDVSHLEVREMDHKLMLDLYSIADKKVTYQDIDPRATWPLAFAPDGKSVVYAIRDKGVGNLWMQPLDGSPRPSVHAFRFGRNRKISVLQRRDKNRHRTRPPRIRCRFTPRHDPLRTDIKTDCCGSA